MCLLEAATIILASRGLLQLLKENRNSNSLKTNVYRSKIESVKCNFLKDVIMYNLVNINTNMVNFNKVEIVYN